MKGHVVSHLKLAVLLLISSTLGAGLMWIAQGHTFSLMPSSMKYEDFVAILLAVLAALLALVGLIFALFALWGWTQFKKGVDAKIREIAPGVVADEIQNGGTRRVLDSLVADVIAAEKSSPGVAQAYAAERQKRREEFRDLDEAPEEE